MTPNPRTGLVTLPEVITGDLARKFGEISLYNQHADFESGSTSNSNSTSRGSLHASRLLSHHVLMPHSTSTSRLVSAMLAGLTRKLSLRAKPARRSLLTTPRTPTPPLATTQTPPTSSISGQIPMSPSPRTLRLSNRCQDQPPAWL
jgi:hypothetical protein